jgi:amino-acid N-acetyltransferase
LTPVQAQALLAERTDYPPETLRQLGFALDACRRGVKRAHLVHRAVNGALLLELFTRDGCGTLINADLYEGVREASIDDVGGILALIAPLEDDGTLVRRSRERLETEIDRFAVVERDGSIIACAALYYFPEEGLGELACVATQQEYRGDGRAEALLQFLEKRARDAAIRKLFVLTTRTAHWFRERGFVPASIEDLPLRRQALYNLQRNSKVFIKSIEFAGR